MPTSFILNGRPASTEADPDRKLLWVLRTDLGLTGTKYGCGKALCGTCVVLVDNRPVRSCMARIGSVQGKSVTTIEGLERDGELHPLQKAFMEHDALQCGFCTPGMILAAFGLLQANPDPSREEIARGLHRNLCRCGAHTHIIDAVQTAATALRQKEVAR